MGDFPADVLDLPATGSISPSSLAAVNGDIFRAINSSFGGTGAWPTANLAFFFPFLIRVPVVVSGFSWLNGTPVSGNVDFGVYDSAGVRACSLGGVAQTGVTAIQTATLTATTLLSGLYYLAAVANNTTGIYNRNNGMDLLSMRVSGWGQMATAYPLPATATIAALTSGPFIPQFAAMIEGATF